MARPATFRGWSGRPTVAATVVVWALATLTAAPVAGQLQLDGVERLDRERPEAWAMRWFAGALAPGGFGPPSELTPGALELGVDAGWLPKLSAADRRVGFDGTKVEEIDRVGAYARPWIRIGLPARLALEVDWLPPVEVDSVRADLPSLALAGALREQGHWRHGWRIGVQRGHVDGDFTCPGDIAGRPDPVTNPMDCERASSDRLELTTVSAEVGTAWAPRVGHPLEWTATVAVRRLDSAFQVDALYAGIRDRVRLEYAGTEWAVRAGVMRRWPAGWSLAGDLAWVPLSIERPGRARSDESLVHLRLALSRRLR